MRQVGNDIEKAVKRIILTLNNNGDRNKAVLANLRKSTNISGLYAPAVWPFIFSVLDEKYLSSDGTPTWAERSVYSALHMYALHQQGSEHFVYKENSLLFSELAKMRRNESQKVALDRRVRALLGTNNFGAVANEISHVIQIMKSKNENLKIDYAKLASDFYSFQTGSEEKVRLSWGIQYYRIFIEQKKSEER